MIKKSSRSLNQLPIVGDIACGTPILAEQNIEMYLPISRAFLGNGDFFILKAQGDSMIGANIDDGDYVVIYDWDYTKEHYAVCVLYERGGQEKRIADNIDCRNDWINELLSL